MWRENHDLLLLLLLLPRPIPIFLSYRSCKYLTYFFACSLSQSNK